MFSLQSVLVWKNKRKAEFLHGKIICCDKQCGTMLFGPSQAFPITTSHSALKTKLSALTSPYPSRYYSIFFFVSYICTGTLSLQRSMIAQPLVTLQNPAATDFFLLFVFFALFSSLCYMIILSPSLYSSHIFSKISSFWPFFPILSFYGLKIPIPSKIQMNKFKFSSYLN